MIIDKMQRQPQVIPNDIESLCDDLQKILRVLDDAKIPIHLDTVQRMLRNLTEKWKLNTKGFTNPICIAIQERITNKRTIMNSMNLHTWTLRETIKELT